ncbi:MAG: hypothetical protein IJ115_04670 [Erysipelotrichaceae bacterium]|nr:hypothetical protein [Erysipelotrichaceae bacterium]
MTLFVIVYLVALFCYFFTRFSDKKLYRALNKYLMATMYLVLGIVTFVRKYEFTSYQTILMAALFFAWLGDIFLIFDFGRGGDFFLAGNVCFTLFEVAVMKDHGLHLWDFGWAFAVSGIMILLFILSCKFKPETFKLGKMRMPMTFYLMSIFTHGMTGMAMAMLLPGTNYVMMGIGSVLFMISDMILVTYKFVLGDNIWLIRANSLTYFTGLLLIVLSTL